MTDAKCQCGKSTMRFLRLRHEEVNGLWKGDCCKHEEQLKASQPAPEAAPELPKEEPKEQPKEQPKQEAEPKESKKSRKARREERKDDSEKH